jgi:hypothetical protein
MEGPRGLPGPSLVALFFSNASVFDVKEAIESTEIGWVTSVCR